MAVWDAFATGESVNFPPANNGDKAAIRAAILAELLTLPEDAKERPRPALHIADATISGRLDLRSADIFAPMDFHDCVFEDEIDLSQATGRDFSVTRCQLARIDAYQLTLKGDFDCTEITAHGEVVLSNATIGGSVQFTRAALRSGRFALIAEGATLSRDLTFLEGLAIGEVRLDGAKIGGTTRFDRARLDGQQGLALTAEGTTFTRDLIFAEGLLVGEIWLNHATVGGELRFDRAKLSSPGGLAILADAATVGRSLVFREATLLGEIRLDGIQVGSTAAFQRAHFSNPSGLALSLRGATFGRDLVFQNGDFDGELALDGARVAGTAYFEGAVLRNEEGTALSAEQSEVGQLQLTFGVQPQGDFRLANMKVGKLVDGPDSWPNTVYMDGLTYTKLESSERTDAGSRLQWLSRNPELGPQPYDWLADVYRRDGQDRAARDVLIGYQRRRRQSLRWPGKAVGYLLDALVGYGYSYLRALWWLLAFWAAGTIVFAISPPQAIEPDKAPVYSAAFFALDLLLPIVDLGQEKSWKVTGYTQYVAYSLVLFGWLLTTAVIAVLTPLFNRSRGTSAA
jgi:hypothetical protein